MKLGRFPAAYWWVWAGSLVNHAGSFVIPFFAYYLTSKQGFTPLQVGLVATLYGAGGVLSTVVAGVAADRIGRRPTLLVSQAGAAGAMLALGFAHHVALIDVLAFVLGFTSYAAGPVFSAMIADVVPEEDRKTAYAVHYWAVNLGFAAAPVLAGLMAGSGYVWLFVGDAATTAACAVLIAWRVPEHRPGQDGADADGEQAQGGLGSVLKDHVFTALLLITLGVVVIYTQYQVTQPIAMQEAGLSPRMYGLVSAVNGALVVVIQLPVTRLVDRYHDDLLLAGGALLLGAGMALTAFAHGPAMFAASIAVWTLGEAVVMPTSAAVVSKLAPAHLQGRYQGLYGMAYALAAVIGPLTGGWAFGHLGGGAVWTGCLVLGVASAAGALLVGRGVRARTAPATGEPAVPVG
ncbi:MFS transporter [Streptomyces mashuensis]|uniref:MFS transporter n=1 Tax=Streptomyces mashuensis TaxID=33904 RepID=A0A919B8M8_9ACTN|nr:MFS transporter [Streptomyces mashuensis]GHF69356.1 MFS transporter [Streptomyces mashuensis]